MHFDTLVIGAGTAGCVVAARLSEDAHRTVCLVEAGRDYGPMRSGNWPEDIARPTFTAELSADFDWGYTARIGGSEQRYLRGKVVGGSSAINATGINWGLVRDYDEWEALGNPGWGFRGLLPYFKRVERLIDDATGDRYRGRDGALPVTRSPGQSPFLEAIIEAYRAAGLPGIDASGPEAPLGYGASTRNAANGQRYTSSFAYLDDARDRPNLIIVPETEAVRLHWRDGRVSGVEVRGHESGLLTANRVVLAAGAIGSPLLLQRSGIGPAGLLERLLPDAPIHDLPVGRNLHDHFGVRAALRPSALASEVLGARPGPPATVTARIASNPADDAFDLDLFVGHSVSPTTGSLTMPLIVFLVHPQAEGRVEITGADPDAPAFIDLDAERDEDIDALACGIEWFRERAEHPALAMWVDGEVAPGSGVTGADLRQWVRHNTSFYYHATGTCRMGPADDPRSVVDAHGRVHGFSNLYVADAAVMPTIPRGMINLTVYAVAEKIADGLRTS